MEEIAGFEDRLAGLKERGDHLMEGCSDRVQSRLRQQVQAHQQGTRDSYSAICSTAQRVSEEEEEMERWREGGNVEEKGGSCGKLRKTDSLSVYGAVKWLIHIHEVILGCPLDETYMHRNAWFRYQFR